MVDFFLKNKMTLSYGIFLDRRCVRKIIKTISKAETTLKGLQPDTVYQKVLIGWVNGINY
jgi:hypothetical protein